jgi:hypothetical protein
MIVLKPHPNASARPNLKYNDAECVNEVPANEAEQIPDLFRPPIRTNPIWTDQTVLCVSRPEGSKFVITLPPESSIPAEGQSQSEPAYVSKDEPPGTIAVARWTKVRS